MPEVYTTDQTDDLLDTKADASSVADLAAELSELRGEFEAHEHETTPPDPEPEPGPQFDVIWETDFANGYADFEDARWSNSGGGSGDLDTYQGEDVIRMSVSGGSGSSGARFRMDGATLGRLGPSAGSNLPDESYFLAEMLIPERVNVGPSDGGPNSDSWNIFQWKQTYPSGSGYTRRMIASLRLRDLGNGRYGFTIESRMHESGWGDPKDTWLLDDDINVGVGEWFTVVSFRKFSDGAGQGKCVFWINGVEAFDRDMRTEDDDWDYNDWRRQFTVNNYRTGTHDPGSHDLYCRRLAIGV